MLFCTVHSLGGLAVAFPVAGSFAVYGSRLLIQFGVLPWPRSELLLRISPIRVSANMCSKRYALQWLVTLPLEIVAASITVSYCELSHSFNTLTCDRRTWFVLCENILLAVFHEQPWEARRSSISDDMHSVYLCQTSSCSP